MIRKIRCNHRSGSFPQAILTLATVLGNGGHSKHIVSTFLSTCGCGEGGGG